MSSKPGKNKQAPKGHPKKGGKTPKAQPKVKEPKAKVGWEWQAFTTKAVRFNQAASKLDEHIKMMYGESISITQYEKFCIASDNFTHDELKLARPYKAGIILLKGYLGARDERDAERRSFRDDVEVTDIQGTMASLANKFGDTDFPDETEEGVDCDSDPEMAEDAPSEDGQGNESDFGGHETTMVGTKQADVGSRILKKKRGRSKSKDRICAGSE